MHPPHHLAIIGSGPSALYLLKHLADNAGEPGSRFREISFYEQSPFVGMGMPYNPANSDRHHLSNISSAEIPELPVSFADWLRGQPREILRQMDIVCEDINEDAVYSRLALGRYLQAQFLTLLGHLAQAGIEIHEHASCAVADLCDSGDGVTLTTAEGITRSFGRVVIATGHRWFEPDRPDSGFYASPWPIHKLLPREGGFHNFPIGTLGASLSAFDVVSSLAHHHGEFARHSGRLIYQPYPGTGGFKIVMHSAEGMLPHLQFDQVEPLREIYRHVDRESLMSLRDDGGFLRLETYFDKVCRPVLSKAFEKDNMPRMVAHLADPGFHFTDVVEKLSDKHDYKDAFKGMRAEMKEARESVVHHRPVHWKEAFDDLMYTLNFHAEFLPAEDHLTLRGEILPFLLNVVAAMPLVSADSILALHEAGKLDLFEGKVTVEDRAGSDGGTTITVDHEEDRKETVHYRMFIDCSGQKPLELANYPFPTLVASETVRRARARFVQPGEAAAAVPEGKEEHLFQDDGQPCYHTGGIDIDARFRLIGSEGAPNPRIHDMAFPHTSGVRPYSYGLQACNDTAALVIRSWFEATSASPTNPTPIR